MRKTAVQLEATRKWRREHQKEVLAYQRQYRQNNMEQLTKYNKHYWLKTNYYHIHAEEIRRRAKQWRIDNAERAKRNDKKKYEDNKERHKLQSYIWNIKHLDKRREIVRRSYRKRFNENPAVFRAQSLRRRLTIQSNDDGTITDKTLRNLFDRQQRCEYCGVELIWVTCEFDHRIPLAREGKHSIYNLAVSCRACNRKKGTKLLNSRQADGVNLS